MIQAIVLLLGAACVFIVIDLAIDMSEGTQREWPFMSAMLCATAAVVLMYIEAS